MTAEPARRLVELEESVTLAITARARAMRAEGRDVIGFGAGEPDFDTPENIKEAAVKAIREGQTKYTPVGGLPELKDAIIDKFSGENGLEYTRDEVIVSCGGKHSLYNIFGALLNPGDEVIIQSPYWVSYPAMVRIADGVPVFVHTTVQTGFRMTPDQLAAAVTERTKAVIINSPANPTGTAYSADELRALADVLDGRDILIVSDEIYEKITYDGFKSTSVASVSEDAKARTVIVNGVSKTYAMTGWRIGYAAGPAWLVKAMTKLQSQSTSNPASISQWAALEAISGPQDSVERMVTEFSKRRDIMVDALGAIEGVECPRPEGAFYVFADFSSYFGKKTGGRIIKGSVDLAEYLLESAGAAVVPGAAFGEDNCMRLSYAVSREYIKQGIERIKKALYELS